MVLRPNGVFDNQSVRLADTDDDGVLTLDELDNHVLAGLTPPAANYGSEEPA